MDFEQFKRKYQKREVEIYPNSVPNDVMISILVQTYNHDEYIEKCLDSILTQKTNFNFEILLGEDSSSDRTRAICLKYARNYSDKIRLFLHDEKNKIKVQNITTGNFNAFYNFFNAQGKYIAFCEGDDYWTDPLKLQIQFEFLEAHEEYSFCYHSFIEKFHDKLSKDALLKQSQMDLSCEELRELKSHPQLSSVCFRRKNISVHTEMLEIINVDSFIISVLGSSGPAKFLKEIQPDVYTRHPRGIWTRRSKIVKLKLKKKTFQKLSQYYKSNNEPKMVKIFEKKIDYLNRSLFMLNFKNFNFKESLNNLRDIKFFD